MSAISKQALLVDNNESFPNNNSGQITPSDLRAFNVNVIDSTVNQTEYTTNSGSWNVSISNINAFTASQQPSFTALNSFTASQLGINTGVNSFTQSATGRLNNLESTTSSLNAWSSSINEIRDNGILQGYSTRLFFEGLVSASIVTNVGGNIATINIEQDGTKLNTSSFNSYTASNNQSFNSYTASTNQRIDSLEVFSGSAKISISALNAFTNSVGPIQTGSLLNTASYSGTTITYTKGDSTTFTNVGIQNTASFNSYTASTDSRLTNIETTTASLNTSVSNINAFTASQQSLNLTFATTGSNTFVGDQTISASLFVSGNTNVGFLNIADAGGINLAGTGSIISSYGIVTNPSNGDLVFNTNPNNGRLMTFSATTGKMTQFNGLYFNAGDGNSTNGGIDFSTYSGSLFLTPSGFSSTTASMLHVSSSSNINNVNLIFKNSNTAADTIVSGSGNIFTNPAAPTAGFKRYMTGGNIAVGGSGVAIPQISGSMAFSPTIANNYFGVSANPITLRGPVSSSAYTITNNVFGGGTINLGTSAANHFERAVTGVSIQSNLLAGAINAIASKTQLSSSVAIGSNIVGGGVTLSMDSSSINFNGNSVQGTLTVNNSYFPSTTGSQVVSSVQGGLYIGSNTIYASGSNATFTGAPGRTINNAVMFGANNVISASLNGDLAQVASTTLIGQGLVVVGSNSRTAGASAADWGSVFVGRWNSLTGNSDLTAETIFAVGTGTGTAARKTGFLIDSGSNTFVEGTLNVSGSTSLTGSLTIQSGSAFFANGNKQFNVGAFTSTITQSGSAAVSQSMTFNVTDISEGVTLNGGGTQFILANSGTYNIQFSAQILADTGADDVWIWLKKNGTNIDNSAGRVTLANNEELMAAWNYVVTAAAGDYFELVWESAGGDALLLYNIAAGNYPAVPSVIATITQVR